MRASVWTLPVLLLIGCGGEPPPPEAPLRSVRTLTIQAPSETRSRTFSGLSESAQASRLSFKVTGTIVRLPVKVGMQLASGDLVAALDPSLYELQAQQAQAALVQARAAERNAQANYERVKGLYENSNAARNDLDAARAAAESAAAAVSAGQKSLELARLNVSYTQLRASNDCTVADVTADLNENVAAGTPVALVNCGQATHVGVSVPEGVIGAINESTQASVVFSAFSERRYAGRVIEAGVASVANAATFPVTLEVVDAGPDVRAGLAAEVTFAFDISGAQIQTIPLAAVVRKGERALVYLAQPDSSVAGQATVVEREVSLGALTDGGVQVSSGLQPGDRVITAGVSVIRPQQRVLLGDNS